MKRLELVQDSFPDDVAFRISTCLEVSDVCSLGSCSKFWREICGSEHLWKSLCEERWPGIVLEEEKEAETHDRDQQEESTLKGWKGLYVEKHNEMVKNVASLKKCLACRAIDLNIYFKAIEDMISMQLGFKDVQMLFLKPRINVLLNLVGLHYCIKNLGVQESCITKAISSRKIQDRQVHIEWCTNAGWMHRFRKPDELHYRCISLKDLTSSEGEEIFRVFEQGMSRVLVRQVQISPRPINFHGKRNLYQKCSRCNV